MSPARSVSSTASSPFSSRALFAVLGIGLATFALGLLLAAFSPDIFGQSSAGNDSYSRSLVGHRALTTWLHKTGLVVVQSRNAQLHDFRPAFPLVLLEPESALQSDLLQPTLGHMEDGQRTAALQHLIGRARAAQAPVVLGLPKWTVHQSGERPGWIDWQKAMPEGAVERTLGVAWQAFRVEPDDEQWQGTHKDSASPEVIRVNSLSNARAAALGLDSVRVEIDHTIQLIATDPRIEPLLSCDQGVLIGRTPEGLLLISDPDLFNNRGLGLGDHAVLLHGLFKDHLGAEGLVLDETMHGFTSGESLLGRAMRFPLVLVVMHIIVTMALLAWALGGRFGKPLSPPPSLPPGKQLLMDNTARLLLAGGEHADALRRYLRVSLQRMARRFSLIGQGPGVARAGQPGLDLVPRLQALSDARGIEVDLAAIVRAAQSPTLKATEALRQARLLHDWRQALLGINKEVV